MFQMPALAVKPNSALSLQKLLCVSHIMFPFLPEVHMVYDAVD